MESNRAKSLGWTVLPDQEDLMMWREFMRRFRFRMGTTSTDWPAIVEPPTSLVFDVADLFNLYDSGHRAEFDKCELELERWVFRFMTENSINNIVALVLNHDGYRGVLAQATGSAENIWPSRIIPTGNYKLFLENGRMDRGIFGHPWEKTICFFGIELVKAIKKERPPILSRILRENGGEDA